MFCYSKADTIKMDQEQSPARKAYDFMILPESETEHYERG